MQFLQKWTPKKLIKPPSPETVDCADDDDFQRRVAQNKERISAFLKRKKTRMMTLDAIDLNGFRVSFVLKFLFTLFFSA